MAAFKFVYAFLYYVEIQRMQKRYIFWKNIDVVVTKKTPQNTTFSSSTYQAALKGQCPPPPHSSEPQLNQLKYFTYVQYHVDTCFEKLIFLLRGVIDTVDSDSLVSIMTSRILTQRYQ